MRKSGLRDRAKILSQKSNFIKILYIKNLINCFLSEQNNNTRYCNRIQLVVVVLFYPLLCNKHEVASEGRASRAPLYLNFAL